MNEEIKQQVLEQMKVIYEIMGSDEFTNAISDFLWKLYQKLVNKGFTSDQAIKIVANMAQSQSKGDN